MNDCLKEVLEENVGETYNILNFDTPSDSKNILENVETINTNIETFKIYVEQRYDAIQVAVEFGLSQAQKSLAWHAATHLKINFSIYKFETINLKREMSHILNSMTREIRNSVNSKPLVNEHFDEFVVTSKHLEMERKTKTIFNLEFSENEK